MKSEGKELELLYRILTGKFVFVSDEGSSVWIVIFSREMLVTDFVSVSIYV